MSDFMPKKVYLWGILQHYIIQKKSAAEAHRILVETYGNHALLETTWRNWSYWVPLSYGLVPHLSKKLSKLQHEEIGLDTSKIIILMLKIKNTLAHQKFWRQRIGGITSWSLMSGACWTCRIIRNQSHNSFKTFKIIRNNSKARTLSAIQVEVKRHQMVSCHMWTAASTTEKKSFFCIISWLVMKSWYIPITLSAFSEISWM